MTDKAPNLTSVTGILDIRHEPIPAERLQALVKDLLDVDDLSRVAEVHVLHDAIEVVVYAQDARGQMFVRTGDCAESYMALDRHVFPIGQST